MSAVERRRDRTCLAAAPRPADSPPAVRHVLGKSSGSPRAPAPTTALELAGAADCSVPTVTRPSPPHLPTAAARVGRPGGVEPRTGSAAVDRPSLRRAKAAAPLERGGPRLSPPPLAAAAAAASAAGLGGKAAGEVFDGAFSVAVMPSTIAEGSAGAAAAGRRVADAAAGSACRSPGALAAPGRRRRSPRRRRSARREPTSSPPPDTAPSPPRRRRLDADADGGVHGVGVRAATCPFTLPHRTTGRRTRRRARARRRDRRRAGRRR